MTRIGILDLFDNDSSRKLSELDNNDDLDYDEVAHKDDDKDDDNEPEIEEKEDTEIEVSQKTKRIRKKDDEGLAESIDKDDVIKIISWILMFVGGGSLLYAFLKRNKGNNNNNVNTSEILTGLMVLMYQQSLQQMNGRGCNGHDCHAVPSELPPKVVIDGGLEKAGNNGNVELPDWAKWYERNKDKEYPVFGKDKKYILNKLHVAENWKVRRDVHGHIIDVTKTNEYIR